MTAPRPHPQVAHVGIAVPRIADALPFYRDVLGLEPGAPVWSDGASIVSLAFGDVHVELLEPRDPDLDAALARCRAAGYRLVDEAPRRGISGHRIAFLHPKATGGILLELTE